MFTEILVAPDSPTPQTDTALRIVALGDSLVYGYGDPVGGGWVEQLRRRWLSPDCPGHVIYNLGIRGNGVAQVAQRLEEEFRHRGELRNRYPDLIILSVGVNDSARLGKPDGRLFTPAERFAQQMTTLIEQAQRLCPVLFVGMVPVDENKMPFLDCLYYSHGDQYRYKELTRKVCDDRHIPYLDLFDIWRDRGTAWTQAHLCSDGLHPNADGYGAILQDVLAWQPIAQIADLNIRQCRLP